MLQDLISFNRSYHAAPHKLLLVNIHIALIEEMMEHIDGIHSCRSLLLTAKDQIDPLQEYF